VREQFHDFEAANFGISIASNEHRELSGKRRLRYRIGFSRAFGVVGKDFVMQHYALYGGPKPPPIDHDGIDNAFTEKGSSVYLQRQMVYSNWRRLVSAVFCCLRL
jgi:hypothetical protein